ncbi:MAG: ROK family protein [Fusobacteriaceae bacterium]
MNVVGIDIGGTEIKYGLIRESGEILEKGSMDTQVHLGSAILIEKIYSIIDSYAQRGIGGVAVSSTGQVDGIHGKVIGGIPLIPGWIGTELVELLEKKYSLPAVLENDVNCAALGEFWKGAGMGEKNFLCLTIGTGIGGGIVIDGDIYRGAGYAAGEFGHFQIERDGRLCSCGKKGCYEAYSSTASLIRLVKEKTSLEQNGRKIFERIHGGDKEFIEIFDLWCDYITDGLATLSYIFNPSLIIIGGGVSAQGYFLTERLKKILDGKIPKNYSSTINLRPAELANDAGILGATYLLLKKMGKVKEN